MLQVALNKGYETKEIEKQPSLTNFNLNLILTCNINIALNIIFIKKSILKFT